MPQVLVLAALLAGLSVNALLGLYVWLDARDLERPALDIPAWLWGVAVLFGSVLAALAYWVMNRSTLVPPAAAREPQVLGKL